MVVDQRVLVDGTENITTGNVISDLELGGVKVPLDASVKSLGVDTTCVYVSARLDVPRGTQVLTGNVDGLGGLLDGFERTLDTATSVSIFQSVTKDQETCS